MRKNGYQRTIVFLATVLVSACFVGSFILSGSLILSIISPTSTPVVTETSTPTALSTITRSAIVVPLNPTRTIIYATEKAIVKDTPIPPTSTSTPTQAPTVTSTSTPIPAVPTSTQAPLNTIPIPTNTNEPVQQPVCDCSSDVYNCSSFGSHNQAQACYNYCVDQTGRDVHGLDGNGNDGLACESLP